MTLQELRDKADAKLVQFWQLLTQKQDAYFAKHGKYFQLLVSPETAVVDGADSTFTVRKPGDEKFAVDVNFPWTDKVPFTIKVDEWVKVDRAGYKATVVVELPSGDKYTRSRSYETVPDTYDNTDPENPVAISHDPVQVDSGWSQVTEEII